jgi:hypothetical protein
VPQCAAGFDRVAAIGRELPGVEASIRYDGSPVLKADGMFVAGLAVHASAEPGTLVVRYPPDDRESLLEDAPEIFYITDYYRKYPLVLARLAKLDRDTLRDLVIASWRMTLAKAPRRKRRLRRAGSERPMRFRSEE